jgi:hypothetical protein
VFEGRQMPVADYAEQNGLNSGMIRRRLAKGWSVEAALTTPSRIGKKTDAP